MQYIERVVTILPLRYEGVQFMDSKQEGFSSEENIDISNGENWATRGASGVARTQSDATPTGQLARTEVLQGTRPGDQRVRKS